MKNKKLTYFLFVLVVVLWGIIIVRVFRFMGKGEIPRGENDMLPSTKEFIIPRDTIKLVADYPDPFLGQLPSRPGQGLSLESEIQEVEEEPQQSQQVISWPDILYGGVIINKNNQDRVCLVKIQSREYLLRQGESVDNVLLKKMYKDSIVVKYQGQEKTIAITTMNERVTQ